MCIFVRGIISIFGFDGAMIPNIHMYANFIEMSRQLILYQTSQGRSNYLYAI
jgi:hypothetical protein